MQFTNEFRGPCHFQPHKCCRAQVWCIKSAALSLLHQACRRAQVCLSSPNRLSQTGSWQGIGGTIPPAFQNSSTWRIKMASKSVPHFTTQSRSVLSGSEKLPLAKAGDEKPAPSAGTVTVSVIVRRKEPLQAAHVRGEQRLTRAQFNASHAADPAAVKLVEGFAKEFGLTVQAGTPAPGRRTMKLTGTVANMQRAFGVSLAQKTIDGVDYRLREGSINLPSELQGYVVAVLGLDDRPQAEPHFRILGEQGAVAAQAAQGQGFAHPHAGSSTSFTPVQVAQLYQFPNGITASGQTIGIIELGGGFRQGGI